MLSVPLADIVVLNVLTSMYDDFENDDHPCERNSVTNQLNKWQFLDSAMILWEGETKFENR